jgi:drug/metabolite transporter (DMT)-like permease
MPLRTASTVTFFYALGYPIGNMAVNAMSPMAVLVFRFGLAALILGTWAKVARVTWPTGRKLGHVAVTGLLMQAVQFCALYVAIQHGAPAVLCAVIVAMNPVATALLAATFLRDRLTPRRIMALLLGVAAVLSACASRLIAEKGVDPAVLLLLVALFGIAAGGVYQQRFCADVDFRASTTIQNAVAFVPAVIFALTTHFAIHDPVKAAIAVTGVVLLGQRVDIGTGVGLLLGALACWLNSTATRAKIRRSDEQREDDPGRNGRRQNRVQAVHEPAVPR